VNCHDVHRSFFALLDGQLALTERAPLEIHLRQCDRCQAELERLRRRSPLRRAVWRARRALEATCQDLSLAPTREFLSRCPPRVFPVAAGVTLLVMLVTYGFQRQAELATTPAERPVAASPMIEAPVPSPEPIAKSEPSILPSAPGPTSPSPGHQDQQIPVARPKAKAMARLHDGQPRGVGEAVVAMARKPSAVWIIGRTKDEQITPEPEPVRRDRD
jgi:Putative zinc-finger